MGQGAHACGIGDLESRPAVMSRQSPAGVVHVVVCKSEENTKIFNVSYLFFSPLFSCCSESSICPVSSALLVLEVRWE